MAAAARGRKEERLGFGGRPLGKDLREGKAGEQVEWGTMATVEEGVTPSACVLLVRTKGKGRRSWARRKKRIRPKVSFLSCFFNSFLFYSFSVLFYVFKNK